MEQGKSKQLHTWMTLGVPLFTKSMFTPFLGSIVVRFRCSLITINCAPPSSTSTSCCAEVTTVVSIRSGCCCNENPRIRRASVPCTNVKQHMYRQSVVPSTAAHICQVTDQRTHGMYKLCTTVLDPIIVLLGALLKKTKRKLERWHRFASERCTGRVVVSIYTCMPTDRGEQRRTNMVKRITSRMHVRRLT